MIPEAEWVWQGHAGHYICADRCLFRMATRVGGVLVSTVGDMYMNKTDPAPSPIGAGPDALFETMVFSVDGAPLACGCAQHDGCDIVCRRYATAADAQAGHMAMCREWAAKEGKP